MTDRRVLQVYHREAHNLPEQPLRRLRRASGSARPEAHNAPARPGVLKYRLRERHRDLDAG